MYPTDTQMARLRFLGAPDKDKRLVQVDTEHIVYARPTVWKEVLNGSIATWGPSKANQSQRTASLTKPAPFGTLQDGPLSSQIQMRRKKVVFLSCLCVF